MDAIRVENVLFCYKDVPVLQGVTFSVQQGDYVGVVGPNGCGKSTLLKLIMGILTPGSGHISLLGEDPQKLKRRSRVAYVAQKAHLLNGSFPASVLEVVAMGLSGAKGMGKFLAKTDWDFVRVCLKTVGMEKFAKSQIGNLSGGQLQRVLIARALASKPEVLILDEPTAGVDTQSVEHICCLLARLSQEQDITVVMTTHDLPSVVAHAKNFLMFDECGCAQMVHNTGDLDAVRLLMGDFAIHGAAHNHAHELPQSGKGCSC